MVYWVHDTVDLVELVPRNDEHRKTTTFAPSNQESTLGRHKKNHSFFLVHLSIKKENGQVRILPF